MNAASMTLIVLLVVGGIVIGLVSEWVARRWR